MIKIKEHLVKKSESFAAGQIRENLAIWENITNDTEVLQIVKGAVIELDPDSESYTDLDTHHNLNLENLTTLPSYRDKDSNMDRTKTNKDSGYLDFAQQRNKDKLNYVDEELCA